MPILNKDMTLCISLSGRPSNIGTRFHNYLYDALGLNYIYKAFSTDDLPAAIAGVRGLGIRGCAVSMPFKEAVIPLVDTLDASAAAIESINTIVNTDGHLTAYNTDYLAIQRLVERHGVAPCSVVVRGSGGMAKAVVAALHGAGFHDGTVLARNVAAGQALAAQYGWQVTDDASTVSADLIVNVTPLGMAGGPEAGERSFSDAAIAAASVVWDVVALPSETPLIRAARAAGKPVITGAEVIAIQAEEQFVLYTGVRPSAELVAEASAFSLAQP
ncbi:shikimate 5-dehydrogenase [Microterricola viridarii]|uniref:Shikimate dehydrogenase n=1 Tax=Microterricola viridarii TaxID=412690 RepID=A0A0Y0MGW5_9MICO|nr:shikimate 5-dehydrogenase [Microterricola viridarii]AMB57535.1 shikimate dehydrogenase [Microterricola viridarii]